MLWITYIDVGAHANELMLSGYGRGASPHRRPSRAGLVVGSARFYAGV
jgi:hypothetical protein